MTHVEPRDDDADAALIDRLYGGPDSDDADDDADLEDLRMVRGLIARVRHQDLEEEPPQAVSARLLQAAEVLAPKRAAAAVEPASPGLWVRLRGWFSTIAAHPAMAAAATLVVVAGATALWMRSGGEVAEPTHQHEHASADQGAAPLEEKAPGAGSRSSAAAEAAPVPAPGGESGADPRPIAPAEPTTGLRRDVLPKPDVASAETRPRPRKAGARPSAGGSGSTGGPAEKAPGERGTRDGDAIGDDEGGAAATPIPESTSMGGLTAVAPPPPPAPARQPEKKKAEPPPPPDAVATQREEVSGAALAAEYTRQAIAAAKKGNCQTVDQLAIQAKAADAGYYQRSFVTQADIKKCLAKQRG